MYHLNTVSVVHCIPPVPVPQLCNLESPRQSLSAETGSQHTAVQGVALQGDDGVMGSVLHRDPAGPSGPPPGGEQWNIDLAWLDCIDNDASSGDAELYGFESLHEPDVPCSQAAQQAWLELEVGLAMQMEASPFLDNVGVSAQNAMQQPEHVQPVQSFPAHLQLPDVDAWPTLPQGAPLQLAMPLKIPDLPPLDAPTEPSPVKQEAADYHAPAVVPVSPPHLVTDDSPADDVTDSGDNSSDEDYEAERHLTCRSKGFRAPRGPRSQVVRNSGTSGQDGSTSGPEDGDSCGLGAQPRRKIAVTKEWLEENGYFDMRARDAASRLGIGVTTLKRYCRSDLNLDRWPWRKRVGARAAPCGKGPGRRGRRSGSKSAKPTCMGTLG